MKCENKNSNINFCTCTYPSCSRKGACCECLRYHLSNNELPGCLFPPEAEATYDRSVKNYLSVCKKK